MHLYHNTWKLIIQASLQPAWITHIRKELTMQNLSSLSPFSASDWPLSSSKIYFFNTTTLYTLLSQLGSLKLWRQRQCLPPKCSVPSTIWCHMYFTLHNLHCGLVWAAELTRGRPGLHSLNSDSETDPLHLHCSGSVKWQKRTKQNSLKHNITITLYLNHNQVIDNKKCLKVWTILTCRKNEKGGEKNVYNEHRSVYILQ